MTDNTPAAHLRQLIHASEILVMPGVWDALSARVAEEVGFRAVFMTGHGVSVTRLGLSDLGFMGLETVVAATRALVSGTTVPVIADADTGYGNAMNVIHAVEEIEGAGAAGLLIEDQVWPKRCGHFEGKSVISADEMAGKIRAAVAARTDPHFLVIARTDSIATSGIEDAVSRFKIYEEAGADVLFADAIEDVEQMEALNSAVSVATMVNIVEGGKTPRLSNQELQEVGFGAVVYAGTGLFASIRVLYEVWGHLLSEGNTFGLEDNLIPFSKFQELMRVAEYLEKERQFVQ